MSQFDQSETVERRTVSPKAALSQRDMEKASERGTTSRYGLKEQMGRGSVRWAGKGGHQGQRSNQTEYAAGRKLDQHFGSREPTRIELDSAQKDNPRAWRYHAGLGKTPPEIYQALREEGLV